MLEVLNLCKEYRPKKGVAVKALDGVSLVFPEKGMVFLLGKSGSGKSTLLNMLGGLDKYDSGEIIVKGVSSKTFAQRDFDSYRNTYVGFIFQEYNVLEEFSVGANIALALELQGKKATDGEINRILEEVDLAGYGARRPNELSGGQLQRVAIARALVKNPEIIMADEPTGALDSNTGRQVLDTLKKLSAEKLVIIVSHDREFAEKYADRIIELGDGRVIRDVEWKPENEEQNPSLAFADGTVSIPRGYRLTEEDRIAINRYIEAHEKGLSLTSVGGGRKFTSTDISRIEKADGSKFKLIKSKLPMKSAFKIGGSGLGHKKFRLVMTILLSTVAFTLFALADTFGSYNHIRTCVDSLIDSNIGYTSIQKSVLIDGTKDSWDNYSYKLDETDLDAFYGATGVYAGGVYVPEEAMSLNGQYDSSVNLTETDYNVFARAFSGFTEITGDDLEKMGYSLVAGNLPSGNRDEIAISAYLCETFIRAGYANGEVTYTESGMPVYKYEKISSASDMVGRTVRIHEKLYTVTGIIDTGFNIERYLPLTQAAEGTTGNAAAEIVDYVLFSEFSYDANYSHARVAFVGEGFIDAYRENLTKVYEMNAGYIWFMADSLANGAVSDGFNFDFSPKFVCRLSDIAADKIIWLDGEKTELGEKEIIVASDGYTVYGNINGEDAWNYEIGGADFLDMLGELKAIGHSDYMDGDINDQDGWKIVGYIDIAENSEYSGVAVLSDKIFGYMYDYRGVYSFAVGPMPENRGDITKLVTMAYEGSETVRYRLQNPVTYELDIVNEVLKVLSKVFVYIGIGFAAFAALLLANFIATSISYKKQEIGILRAIGSRSADVFRIFFSESFIIAMINFVASAGLSAIVTAIVNGALRKSTGILITILHFGVRQVGLLLAVCILVAAAASFFPVKKIASKRPIDAIRNR